LAAAVEHDGIVGRDHRPIVPIRIAVIALFLSLKHFL